ALPEGILEHILGFLPAPEAVRTSVLARSWRDLWKSATGLRIGCRGDDSLKSVKELREFVDHVLLRRGDAPLDTCDFRFGEFQQEDVPHVNQWLRHAIVCKVRVFILSIISDESPSPWLELDDLPHASQQLTRLELSFVQVRNSFLNFTSCPLLEHLVLEYNDLEGRTPILDSMPSLIKAFVRITPDCEDACDKLLDPNCSQCECQYCGTSVNVGDGNNSHVLLKGLSEAKDLDLESAHDMLKTLLLNEYWCMPGDFGALACILEHSPVLEKLALELFSEGPKYKVEMEGSFTVEKSATISEHLNIVKVKCQDVDERVLKVLKFLCTFNLLCSELVCHISSLIISLHRKFNCSKLKWFQFLIRGASRKYELPRDLLPLTV
uniref:F-box domain-containing protein n=1 Tax=Setaria italica TaxID=4555 RepID=K3YM90_SETIT